MDMFMKSEIILNHFSEMVLFMSLVSLLSMVLIMLGLILGQKWRWELAKLTSFECGFDALSSARSPFSLRFFLLALLFLVFDMEIILLFPYVLSMGILWVKMTKVGKMMCFLFLIVLVAGLFHEINEGTLDWKFT